MPPPAGAGIGTGALRFHPTLAIESAYTDNIYKSFRDSRCNRSDATEDGLPLACADVRSAAVFRVMPGLVVRTPNQGRINLDLMANLDLRQYMIDDLSLGDTGNMGGVFKGKAVYGEGRNFKLTIEERFLRVLEPGSEPGLPFHNSAIQNTTRANAVISPRNSNLEFSPHYEMIFQDYENIATDTFISNRIGFRIKLDFLPKTAVDLDSTIGFTHMLSDDAQASSSMPLQVMGGLTGKVSPLLTVSLRAGYANSFHQEGDTYSGPVAHGQIRYHLTDQTRIGLGYSRRFDNTIVANYYVADRGELELDMELFPKLTLSLNSYLEGRRFSTLFPIAGFGVDYADSIEPLDPDRNRGDRIFSASATLWWYPREWLRGGVGYKAISMNSNARALVRLTGAEEPEGGPTHGERLKEAKYFQNYLFMNLGMIY